MSVTKEKEATVAINKPIKDVLTPHRLSVALLIRSFCTVRQTTKIVYKKFIGDFCILCLRLIQSPDLSFEELRDILNSEEYFLVNDRLLTKFEATISNINKMGITHLLDILDSIGALMSTDGNVVAKGGIVNKNSVVGYFLRRLVINFDKLTFFELTSFLKSFNQYTSYSIKKNLNCLGVGTSVLKSDDRDQWSRRQAELFIATQSALITKNEQKALSPNELHVHLSNLLKSNPDLAEAHFLNYLNYMRVKEYCGAIDSLYHCFDKSAVVDSKGTSDEKSKSYRFAALNLAVLQYQFGHKQEALAALKEAIRMAQEANDNVCLQHSLSWLYCIQATNKHKLIEHSILKSLNLNLSYLMSLGIQSYTKYAGLTMGSPRQVFDTITKSDIINCQHGHRDLVSSSYSQKSSMWLFYGKTEMSSLWAQLLLYLNTDISINKTYYGEGSCQAMCAMANKLYQEGEYSLAYSIIQCVKERFPVEPFSRIWMMCENIFNFQHALFNGKLPEAESAAEKIAVINRYESCLRMAELHIHKRDFNAANHCINQLLGIPKDGSKRFRMDIQVRARLLLAQIQISTSFPNIVIPGIVDLLNTTTASADEYHLSYLSSMSQLYIAHVELLMGMPSQALSIINRCIIQILAHGGVYDRARSMLLYVKCIIAQSANKTEEERNATILDAALMLNTVKSNFEKAEAFFRVKDVLYFQAKLYDELNLINARNVCAMEYRHLDEDYPTNDPTTLLTFV